MGTWDFIFNNPLAIGLYLLHMSLVGQDVKCGTSSVLHVTNFEPRNECKTRMHSSRMLTTCSSSRPWLGGRRFASVHAGIHTPQVWTWRHQRVWAWRPPGQTPQLPPWVWAWRPPQRPARHPGIPSARHAGIPPPGDLLQGMLGYYHPPPPWTKFLKHAAENISLPKFRLRAVIKSSDHKNHPTDKIYVDWDPRFLVGGGADFPRGVPA